MDRIYIYITYQYYIYTYSHIHHPIVHTRICNLHMTPVEVLKNHYLLDQMDVLMSAEAALLGS